MIMYLDLIFPSTDQLEGLSHVRNLMTRNLVCTHCFATAQEELNLSSRYSQREGINVTADLQHGKHSN